MDSLHKFIRKPEDVSFLLRGRIKFTPIPELNDPSELFPAIIPDEVKKSLILLRKRGYTEEDMVHLQHQGALLQRLAPEFQAVSVPATKEEANKLICASFYDNFTLLSELLQDTTQKIASEVGLFVVLNETMHYRCGRITLMAQKVWSLSSVTFTSFSAETVLEFCSSRSPSVIRKIDLG